MIKVSMQDDDALSILSPKYIRKICGKNDGIVIDVSISGDNFDIPTRLQKLLLPIKGDITPVSFKLTPKRSGDHNIEISFYYKLNLLMILSASLHAIDLSPVVHVGSSKKYQFLHLDVVGSSDKGFESIIEIEKS